MPRVNLNITSVPNQLEIYRLYIRVDPGVIQDGNVDEFFTNSGARSQIANGFLERRRLLTVRAGIRRTNSYDSL